MKCRNCGRPAKRYTVNSKDGEVYIELCAECYKRLYADEDGLYRGRSNAAPKECPACGTSFEDFRRTGLLGCAECYNTFRDDLIPVLSNIQFNVYHEGNGRAGMGEAYDDLRGLIAQQERLQTELDEAVQNHDKQKEDETRIRLTEIRKQLRRTCI